LITQMTHMFHNDMYVDCNPASVGDEFIKMIMQSSSNMTDSEIIYKFEIFMRIGGGKDFFPYLFNTVGVKQDSMYHRENVFAHTCMVFNEFLKSGYRKGKSRNEQIIMAMVCLYHDTGKPTVQKWSDEKERYTFFGHEEISAEYINELKEIEINYSLIDSASKIIGFHMLPNSDMSKRSAYKIYRAGVIDEVFVFAFFDKSGRISEEYISLYYLTDLFARTVVAGQSADKVDGNVFVERGFKGKKIGILVDQTKRDIFYSSYDT